MVEEASPVLGGQMKTRILEALRQQYLGALALFVALGGTSYAAVTLDAGSVGSREIADRSVEGRDLAKKTVDTGQIAPDAVTPSRIPTDAIEGDEVENGSLLARDFRPDQLPKGDKKDKGDT